MRFNKVYLSTIFLIVIFSASRAPNMRWTSSRTQSRGIIFWSDDFELDPVGKSPANWYDASGSARVVTDVCHSGTRCVEILSVGAGSNLLWRCSAPDPNGCPQHVPPSLPSDFFTSHWIRMSSGWAFPAGNYFKWIYDRTNAHPYGTCYYDGQAHGPLDGFSFNHSASVYPDCDGLGNNGGVSITADTNWHRLEQHITAGSSFETWWDGKNLGSLRGTVGQTGNFKELGIGIYFNGSPPNGQHLWIDDVTICTGGRCP